MPAWIIKYALELAVPHILKYVFESLSSNKPNKQKENQDYIKNDETLEGHASSALDRA